jgi:ABC-2 type transport system permease protein
MSQFAAFTKKEFVESAATYRLYIMLSIFLIFGILSPMMARLLPLLIENMGDTGGFIIIIPEPTAMDSWAMFFSNVGELGIPILVIIFCGIMSNEFSKGTLINLLSKGLKRHTVILSKFFTAGVLWTMSYLVCFGICYGYTVYFWESIAFEYALLTFISPWLFGLYMLSLLILIGTLLGNIYGNLLVSLGVAVIMLMVSSFVPRAARFVPINLAGGTVGLVVGTSQPSDFIPAVIICVVMILVFVAGAVLFFNKKTV